MKFTQSIDGNLRATVKISFRLLKIDIEILKATAKFGSLGINNWKNILKCFGDDWADKIEVEDWEREDWEEKGENSEYLAIYDRWMKERYEKI